MIRHVLGTLNCYGFFFRTVVIKYIFQLFISFFNSQEVHDVRICAIFKIQSKSVKNRHIPYFLRMENIERRFELGNFFCH